MTEALTDNLGPVDSQISNYPEEKPCQSITCYDIRISELATILKDQFKKMNISDEGAQYTPFKQITPAISIVSLSVEPISLPMPFIRSNIFIDDHFTLASQGTLKFLNELKQKHGDLVLKVNNFALSVFRLPENDYAQFDSINDLIAHSGQYTPIQSSFNGNQAASEIKQAEQKNLENTSTTANDLNKRLESSLRALEESISPNENKDNILAVAYIEIKDNNDRKRFTCVRGADLHSISNSIINSTKHWSHEGSDDIVEVTQFSFGIYRAHEKDYAEFKTIEDLENYKYNPGSPLT